MGKRTIVLFAKFPGKEDHNRLYDVAEQVQRAVNRIWMAWLREALERKEDFKARESQLAYKAWVAAGSEGKAPKDSLRCYTEKFQSRAAHEVHEVFPEIHGRVVALLAQETVKRIANTKSTIGAMPLWKAALLNLQNPASAHYRHPICFDSSNASFEAVETSEGKTTMVLTVRIDRYYVEGNTNAKSDPIKLELSDKSKYRDSKRSKVENSYTSPLEKLSKGDAKFCGSEIIWQQKKSRWKVVITVDVPDVPLVHGKRTMILRPGVKNCWETEIPGESPIFLRCTTDRVAYLRKSSLRQRQSRNDPYGGNRRIGHGRKRRLSAVGKLTGRWEQCTRKWTQQVAAELVRRAVKRGVHIVRYEPPQEAVALDKAGTVESVAVYPWPWHPTRAIFEQEFKDSGIEFISDSHASSGHKGRKSKKKKPSENEPSEKEQV